MFWETAAALLLLAATFPLWVLAALAWGAIKALLTFVVLFAAFFSTPFDFGELLFIPLAAIFEGAQSAWSIPSRMWQWAKFEHPWWAAAIGFAFLVMSGGGGDDA